MLKWIEILASFFAGRMQSSPGPSLRESALAIFEEVTFKSRKAVSLIVISFAAAIFALGGFFISLINATTQYDRDGAISPTATFLSGIVLILIAVAAFAWVFNSAWPGVKKYKTAHKHEESREFHERTEAHQHVHHKEPSSLEQALSALVMDFVQERRERRQEMSADLFSQEPDFRAPSMARNESASSMNTTTMNSGLSTGMNTSSTLNQVGDELH